MKTKLNITIEQNLLEKAKVYAVKKHLSLSSIVEDYFEMMVRESPREKSILDLIDKLEPNQEIIEQSYKKDAFYETQKEKHGL